MTLMVNQEQSLHDVIVNYKFMNLDITNSGHDHDGIQKNATIHWGNSHMFHNLQQKLLTHLPG